MTDKSSNIILRAFKYGLFSQLFSFLDLADDADQTLFNNMLKKQHCLQVILPDVKTSSLHLRQKGHMFDLPRCFLNVVLSCCHHSLCMYVCYVYFNKDQSITVQGHYIRKYGTAGRCKCSRFIVTCEPDREWICRQMIAVQ